MPVTQSGNTVPGGYQFPQLNIRFCQKKKKEIFGLRKVEISDVFRILKSEKVYGLYSTPGIKKNAIPVTDHGGPYGCETSRLPHFL
jgi:hypothetical protein